MDVAKETLVAASSATSTTLIPQQKGASTSSIGTNMALPSSHFGLVCGHDEEHPFCESNTFAYFCSDGCANNTAFDKTQAITPQMVLQKLIDETKGYCLELPDEQWDSV